MVVNPQVITGITAVVGDPVVTAHFNAPSRTATLRADVGLWHCVNETNKGPNSSLAPVVKRRATRLCGWLRPARNAVATTESALISRALGRPKPRRDKECLAQVKKWVPAVSRPQTPDGPQ